MRGLVVDSSCLVAILLAEPDAMAFVRALRSESRLISALTLFESRTVIMRRHAGAYLAQLDHLLGRFPVEIIPFDSAQSDLATDAYRRFGRGSGHRAKLNLADCAAYALALSRDLPLLYKGEDFAATDVRSALAEPAP